MPIFALEILKLNFQIPGKILSEILVRHSLESLVTPVTPLGGHFRSLNNHIISHQNFSQKSARNPEIKVKNFWDKNWQNILSFLSYKEIYRFFDN